MEILLGILAILVFGIVPMVIYALILWWFDRYEKEPVFLLIAAFVWGAVPSVIFSLIAEIVLDIPITALVDPAAAMLVGVAVIAPVVEEFFKSSVLWLWLAAGIVNRLLLRYAPQVFQNKALRVVLWIFFPPFFREIDSLLDGIIYGGLVGFGFAAVENVFYFIGAFAEGGAGGVAFLAVMRAFVFGLNHALFTGLTGLGFALARITRHWPIKIIAPIAGLGLGILSHAIHNGTVSFGGLCWPCLITFASNYGGVLFLLVIIVWSTLRERQWIVQFLADEVKQGTLNQAEYEEVSSSIKRVAAQASTLFKSGPKRWWQLGRFHHLATELAFSKRRLTHFPGEEDTQQQIEKLRQQVAELGKQLR